MSGVATGVVGSASSNVGSAVAGSYGSINIAVDGSYTYTVNNSNSDVQALRTSGQTLQDVFTYTMRDAAGLMSTTQITVTIQGANDTPSNITGTLSVAENAANSTAVGTVSATDVDSGDSFTYALLDNAGGRFAIASSTGVISVANAALLDYESNTSHAIVVRTTDASGAQFSKTLTVSVTNVNEAPVDVSTATQSITIANPSFEANSLGDGGTTATPTGWTVTGSAGGFNPTTSNFSSGNGTDGSNIAFANTGASLTQTLATQFDTTLNYHLSVDVGRRLDMGNAVTFSVQLLADATVIGQYDGVTADMGGWATVNIDVNGANYVAANGGTLQIVLSSGGIQTNFDNVILSSSTAAGSIAENSANGAVVATVAGMDRESGSVFTYSLLDDAGGRFAIGSSSGQITVANGSLLDYETSSSHSVVIRVTDQGSLTFDRTMILSLTNVNETPVAVSDSAAAAEAGGINNGTGGTNPGGNVLTNDTDVDASDTKTVNGVVAGTASASGNEGALRSPERMAA
ncbi:MAG: cadherin domain-containing protein [Planctomycetaceae bacterium]